MVVKGRLNIVAIKGREQIKAGIKVNVIRQNKDERRQKYLR